MTSQVTQKVEAFFSKYSLRKYKKGQLLFFAGDEPQHILCLVSGQVRQYDITYRGDEVVVNLYKPLAFLPMLSALTELPNRFFFDAATDIEVRMAPAAEVVSFLKANPDVALDLLTRLYTGVDGLLQRMAHLMGGSAHSRILFELLLEARRFGKPTKEDSYELSLTEGELASRVGLTRETTNRELHKLKEHGTVEILSHGILLKNIAAVEQQLGQGL